MNRKVPPEYFLLHLLAANGGISIARNVAEALCKQLSLHSTDMLSCCPGTHLYVLL